MLRKKILLNTGVNSAGKMISFALQIFIITYLVKNLGKESYGLIVLSLALVGNTNILEAGFGLAVTKYVAECRAKGEHTRLLNIVNTNIAVSAVIALGFCSLLLILNELFLGSIFAIPSPLVSDTRNLIRILIPLGFIDLLTVSMLRIAEGYQRFALARGIELAKWFMRALFMFVAVSSGYGMVGIGTAYLLAGILNLMVTYVVIIIYGSGLTLSLRHVSRESFKEIMGFSIWIFLSKAFAFLSYRIDTIVIGIFLSPVNLAYYNVAFKIFEVLRYCLSLISSTLVPVVSELVVASDRRRLSILFDKATRYSLLVTWPVFVLSFFYMEDIIHYWLGMGFEPSVLLGRLFVAALFAIALISSGSEMMIGINRLKTLIKFNAAATVFNLVVSIYLVRKIGVYGVVVGTIAGSFILLITYLPTMAGAFGLPLKDFTLKVVSTTVSPIIFMILSLYFLPHYIGLIVASTGYLCFSLVFLIDRDDMKGILASLNIR